MRIVIILFISSYLFNSKVYSQTIQKSILSAINKDSLKNIYGNNKKFVAEYELQSLIALSFYPELINRKITFKLTDKESVAKTTITFFSIFKSADKHFIIYINDNKKRTGFLLNDAPFTAQIGAIGHELAHVADFNRKNLPAMIWWGIKYVSGKERIKIERRTDLSTINHGLGMELYNFIDFVFNGSSANNNYKKFKQKNYLSGTEILQLTKNLNDIKK